MNKFIKSGWLANSNFKQPLVEHSVAVALQALTLFREQEFALNEEKTSLKGFNKKIASAEASIVAAGLYHDLGKFTPRFQTMLRGNEKDHEEESTNLSKEEKWVYFRHEEVSYALIKGIASLNSSVSEDAAYAIFYHHDKDSRDFSGFSVEKILGFAMENKAESEGMKELQEWVATFNEQAMAVAVKIQDNSDNQTILDGCAYIIALLKKIALKKEEDEDLDIKNGSAVPPAFYRNASQGALSLSSFHTKENAWRLLLRSALVSADRLVSAMPTLNEELYSQGFEMASSKNKEATALLQTIAEMRSKFPSAVNGNRSAIQEGMSKDLSKVDGVAVLQGPAGCGKTKIALQWVKALNEVASSTERGNKPKRLFIVTPRTVVAKGLYGELTKKEGRYGFGVSGAASVELITGDDKWLFKDGVEMESKDSRFEGDVVVLTIDQVTSMMYSHKKIDILLDFVNSAVVFDEFHEFFNISGMVVMLKTMLDLLDFYKNPQVLLVSATPNLYFLNELGVKGVFFDEKKKKHSRSSNLLTMDSFNDKPITMSICHYQANDKKDAPKKKKSVSESKDENEGDQSEKSKAQPRERWSMYGETYQPGDIFIFNTATDSQIAALRALRRKGLVEVINFHSRLTSKHRQEVLSAVYGVWGEANQSVQSSVLFSGPIVQASLDISTARMFTEECSAENMLQRMGRLNRFAYHDESEFILNVVEKKNAGKVTNVWKFFKSENQINTWSDFLQEKLRNGQKVDLLCMYDLYYEYQRLEGTREAYKEDFKEVLKETQQILEKNMFAPLRYRAKQEEGQGQKRLSQYSLRAASSYVVVPLFNEKEPKKTDWLSSSAEDLDNHLTLEDANLRKYLDQNVAENIGIYKEEQGFSYTYDFSKLTKNKWVKVENGTYQVREKSACISYLLRNAKSPESPVILNSLEEFKKSKKGKAYVMYGETPIGLMNLTKGSENKDENKNEAFNVNDEQ